MRGTGRLIGLVAGAAVSGGVTWALTRRWQGRLPGQSSRSQHLGEPDPFSERGHPGARSAGDVEGDARTDGKADPATTSSVWLRRNFHDETVSLVAGPALAVGVAAGVAAAPGLNTRTRAAGVGGALVIGAVGLYDDLADDSSSKGLGGHLAALRNGSVTSGAIKVGAIGMAGLASAAAVSENALDAAVGGLVVAGHANLLNLLDLRPGRAGKVALLHAPLVLAGPGAAVGAATLGAVAASLPDDLGERTMLGDAGANVLGGMLGLALVAREGRGARLLHLGAVTALTLASEKVSFTKVIERTPVLRELDHLGRRR